VETREQHSDLVVTTQRLCANKELNRLCFSHVSCQCTCL